MFSGFKNFLLIVLVFVFCMFFAVGQSFAGCYNSYSYSYRPYRSYRSYSYCAAPPVQEIVYVNPAPYYAPPAPVYYQPAPVYAPPQQYYYPASYTAPPVYAPPAPYYQPPQQQYYQPAPAPAPVQAAPVPAPVQAVPAPAAVAPSAYYVPQYQQAAPVYSVNYSGYNPALALSVNTPHHHNSGAVALNLNAGGGHVDVQSRNRVGLFGRDVTNIRVTNR